MAHTKKKRKKAKIILTVFILFILAFCGYIVIGENIIVVTNYNISTDKTDESFQFVLISDLHNKEFGKNNERLVSKIKEQNPEFIAVVGDLNLKQENNTEVAVNLIKELVKIADVYYTPGNHETSSAYYSKIISEIEDAGAINLINKSAYRKIGDSNILIGGLKQFPFFEYDMPDYENVERYFFDDFLEKQKECFSILLCHYPEVYIWKLKDYDIDLLLCGHTHGGIIRIPFLGGVKTPSQPYFSEYDKGYFESDSAKMIITSGLGNSHNIPRINNFPEICVISVN